MTCRDLSKVFFLAVLYCWILISCAQIVPLTGGEDDTTPPRLDTLNSTKNFQTNYRERSIELAFDEWLQLKDVSKQVVISPPLKYLPSISLKKKSVVVEFDEEEVLRDSATYIINFGESVQDLTEGNPVPDLRFVFSTGDYIDSLEVEGTVTDALTGEPIENARLLFYDVMDDSLVYLEKPFYFGVTDKAGKVSIGNMKADTFKVVALMEEGNPNYLFNPAIESIGFLDTALILNDTVIPKLNIQLFKEAQSLRIQKGELKNYGLAKFIFNQKPRAVDFRHEEVGQKTIYEYDADTVKLWYHFPDSSQSWNVFVQKDSIINDTFNIKALSAEKLLTKSRLRPTGSVNQQEVINTGDTVKIKFNHPLVAFDTSLIQVYIDTAVQEVPIPDSLKATSPTTDSLSQQDSLKIPLDTLVQDSLAIVQDTLQRDTTPKAETLQRISAEIMIDSSQAFRELTIAHNWKVDKRYVIRFDSAAITDLFGLVSDSLEFEYRIEKAEARGNINIQLDSLSADINYVLELMNDQKEVIATKVIESDTTATFDFKQLPKGVYTARITEDLNKNGVWDTGDYLRRRQPERQFERPIEELRPDWDVEAVIVVEF